MIPMALVFSVINVILVCLIIGAINKVSVSINKMDDTLKQLVEVMRNNSK